jgi:hypothetical protein
MVENAGAFVKSTGMPGIRKVEELKIEVVGIFVNQRAEKRAKGVPFLFHRSVHPDSDHHGGRMIFAEEFTRPVFPNVQGARCKNANWTVGHSLETRQ